MSTSYPPPQPRGIDYSLPTCGDNLCNGRGTCVAFPGSNDMKCECELGYMGDSCEDTVNGSLSLPLTLSVIGVICGLLILAFIVAKIRQRQKQRRRALEANMDSATQFNMYKSP